MNDSPDTNPSKAETRKKILYLITKSEPYGGAQKYIYDLATSMPKDRFDAVVAFGGSGILKDKLRDANIRTREVKGMRRNMRFFGELAVFWNILKIIRDEKPDIVHSSSTKAGGIGSFASRIARVPRIVFTAHGWVKNEDRSKIQKQVIHVVEHIIVSLTHVTIVLYKKAVDEFGGPKRNQDKLHVVHNGISEYDTAHTFSRSEARKKLSEMHLPLSKAPTNAVWIGTSSELHINKGLDYALRAFKSILSVSPTAILVVLGEGEERNRLATFASKLGIREKVFFVGYVPEASKYLKAFDVFTLTSHKEALPYALLEASLAELPIVASRVGGTPEIIDHLQTGILTEVGNVENISEALSVILGNLSDSKELGRNAKKKVLANFSKESMVEKTIALYQN